MPATRRPWLLLNPRAGGLRPRRARASLEEEARRLGLTAVHAEDPASVVQAAREAAAAGAERVLVAGGDGTMHAAIQALAGTACALGIVPCGRGNDLARALGLPLRPVEGLRVAHGGVVRAVDLGRVGSRWFGCVGSVGLDADVAEAARRSAVLRGPAAYPVALLRTLPSFRPPHLRIEHEGGAWEGPAMLAAFANGATYGGGMRIAPGARVDDGALDAVVVGALPRRTLLALFPRVYRGRHLGHPALATWRARRIRVSSDRPLVPWGDGEPLAEVPSREIAFEAVAGALRVVTAETPPPGRP